MPHRLGPCGDRQRLGALPAVVGRRDAAAVPRTRPGGGRRRRPGGPRQRRQGSRRRGPAPAATRSAGSHRRHRGPAPLRVDDRGTGPHLSQPPRSGQPCRRNGRRRAWPWPPPGWGSVRRPSSPRR
jgi:hypothetical protein